MLNSKGPLLRSKNIVRMMPAPRKLWCSQRLLESGGSNQRTFVLWLVLGGAIPRVHRQEAGQEPCHTPNNLRIVDQTFVST